MTHSVFTPSTNRIISVSPFTQHHQRISSLSSTLQNVRNRLNNMVHSSQRSLDTAGNHSHYHHHHHHHHYYHQQQQQPNGQLNRLYNNMSSELLSNSDNNNNSNSTPYSGPTRLNLNVTRDHRSGPDADTIVWSMLSNLTEDQPTVPNVPLTNAIFSILRNADQQGSLNRLVLASGLRAVDPVQLMFFAGYALPSHYRRWLNLSRMLFGHEIMDLILLSRYHIFQHLMLARKAKFDEALKEAENLTALKLVASVASTDVITTTSVSTTSASALDLGFEQWRCTTRSYDNLTFPLQQQSSSNGCLVSAATGGGMYQSISMMYEFVNINVLIKFFYIEQHEF